MGVVGEPLVLRYGMVPRERMAQGMVCIAALLLLTKGKGDLLWRVAENTVRLCVYPFD